MSKTVRSWTGQQTNGALLTLALAYPSEIVAGELLLAAVTFRNGALTTPAGWTLAYTTPSMGTGVNQSTAIFTKVADGTESGTEDFTSTDNGRKNGYMFCVQESNAVGQVIEAQLEGYPSVNPTWSTETIYIGASTHAIGDISLTFTNVPTRFGLESTTPDLRMLAGWHAGGITSSYINQTVLFFNEIVAIELVFNVPPPATNPPSEVPPDNVFPTHRSGGVFRCKPRRC